MKNKPEKVIWGRSMGFLDRQGKALEFHLATNWKFLSSGDKLLDLSVKQIKNNSDAQDGLEARTGSGEETIAGI